LNSSWGVGRCLQAGVKGGAASASLCLVSALSFAWMAESGGFNSGQPPSGDAVAGRSAATPATAGLAPARLAPSVVEAARSVPSQPEAAASSSSASTALAVFGGTERAERRGWFLKKSKSDKSWSQVHHRCAVWCQLERRMPPSSAARDGVLLRLLSHRYVVCRGHALSYYDGKVESLQAAGLRGVVDLREVRRLRPSGAHARRARCWCGLARARAARSWHAYSSRRRSSAAAY
jgi:hypothetical protein